MFLTQRKFLELCDEYGLSSSPAIVVLLSAIGRGVEVDESALRTQLSMTKLKYGH